MSMSPQGSPHFAEFRLYHSTAIILCLCVAVIFGFVVYRPIITDADRSAKRTDGDLILYQRIAEQIHSGANYYIAAGNELRRMGYPTRSVFNWRLPTLAWILGYMPSIRSGQFLVIVLTSIAMLIWLRVLQQYHYGRWQMFFGGIILSGPVVYSLIPGPVLNHEFWAGTLIALSLAAYAKGWRVVSISSGLTALFLRELSLPFVCVMMVISFIEGKRQEALIWFTGLLLFCGFFLYHWTTVSKLMMEQDHAMQGGWFAFGGWQFVLHTAQTHPYLLLLPTWVTIFILPLALLGLCWRRSPLGIRVAATVGIYVLAFLIVGRPLNKYWGMVYAFVFPLGLLHAPAAFKDLWRPFQKKLNAQTTS